MHSDTDPGRDVPRWFLDAIATPAEEAAVNVGETRIAVRCWGPADAESAVVLVHGGSANSHWWDHVAPLLGDDRQVFALDMSGHGDSDRRSIYSLDDWSEEVAAVCAAAGVPPNPILVGHSMGGWVALNCTINHPDLVGGVVVLDSPIREFSPEEQAAIDSRAFGPLKVYPDRGDAIARFRPVPKQENNLPYVLSHIAETSLRDVPGGWSWKFDPQMFARNMPRPDMLKRVNARVALIRSQFGLVTPSVGDQMYEWLGRRAPVFELPLAGHHPMLDQPIPLIAALRAILADWEHSSPITAAR
jgi:pimeloyl-ACP methyl ester carboxylesterase